MEKETYTIVDPKTGSHYDTDDQRFYSDSWERTMDRKSYLELIIIDNAEKFKGCVIENNEH